MVPLGEAERKNRPFLEEPGCSLFRLLILTHPDGAQAQDGHLEAVPVAQAVEGQKFGIFTVAGRVPATVGIAAGIFLGRQQLGKDLLLADEFDKLTVPDLLAVIIENPGLAHLFEEGHSIVHDGS